MIDAMLIFITLILFNLGLLFSRPPAPKPYEQVEKHGRRDRY
jgi:hypothetical protein